jgi:hypothetical protein
MNKEQIDFLKGFVRIFEKAEFKVTGPELLNIATQIQNYAKVVTELEKSLAVPKEVCTMASTPLKKK